MHVMVESHTWIGMAQCLAQSNGELLPPSVVTYSCPCSILANLKHSLILTAPSIVVKSDLSLTTTLYSNNYYKLRTAYTVAYPQV